MGLAEKQKRTPWEISLYLGINFIFPMAVGEIIEFEIGSLYPFGFAAIILALNIWMARGPWWRKAIYIPTALLNIIALILLGMFTYLNAIFLLFVEF